jgi:hypothetical protein
LDLREEKKLQMPKKFKGENTKGIQSCKVIIAWIVAAANEKKAVAASAKAQKQAQLKEEKESAEWNVGAKKNKKDADEAKKALLRDMDDVYVGREAG